MTTSTEQILNANQAVARIAYKTNEVFPIYPITPASEMAELIEQWSAMGKLNAFGQKTSVFQMQSESGVAGAMHGALQTGSLSSTFTASQGLLLMLPNMYKIAAELTPNVIHIATRSIATHALSIFGDHSDVMAVRQSGYAMLSSASVQEAQDFALISQSASLNISMPFLHFFDGFRTSHEINKIKLVSDDTIKSMINPNKIGLHRQRALNPNKPVLRGTAQGPDVFFQSRESINPLYDRCPEIIQECMDAFASLTGRQYKLFDYCGHPDAEHLIIAMASSTDTIETTVNQLNKKGEKLGLIKVRLFRPFSTKYLINALPKSLKSIAVLDRTKEPGSSGEPLYLDVLQSITDAFQNGLLANFPKVMGGRYGLASKEFTPAMVNAIFTNLKTGDLKHNFTIGITDDVQNLSLDIPKNFKLNTTNFEAIFFQKKEAHKSFTDTLNYLGANEKIYVQGYTQNDYKKSNTYCIAHLRTDKTSINLPYLIEQADFIGCESTNFVQYDTILEKLKFKGTLLVNTKLTSKAFWQSIPDKWQVQINTKQIRIFIVNLEELSASYTLNEKLPSAFHSCFLALTHLRSNNTLDDLREFIYKVDTSLIKSETNGLKLESKCNESLLDKLLANKGNSVPVSLLPNDGSYPTNTSQYNAPQSNAYIPDWHTDLCTQCGLCSLSCPQTALRIKVFDKELENSSSSIVHIPSNDFDLMRYTIQINPSQCNGCNNCVDACPTEALSLNAKKKNEQTMMAWKQFEAIPELNRTKIDPNKLSQQQLQEPLFKYPSGAEGCGEAPYLKLLSQLFGSRLLIANATGASSIFGGALPTTPWATNAEGQGPAWSNSLFEDNAEFGLGFRKSINHLKQQATGLLEKLMPELSADLVERITNAPQNTETQIQEQRQNIKTLKRALSKLESSEAKQLMGISDNLIKKSVWIVGGDGWAYDIGYGGLDHAIASGENINILVLDNEVYDNTGAQASKATPYGAVAKFASQGKRKQKKDLGLLAMSYSNVYVASVSMGADPEQTLKAFNEAESFNGPSIIIAYAHSNSHGIDMGTPQKYHKAAVNSGQWLLYRNDPRRKERGLPHLQLDTPEPSIKLEDYLRLEKRYSTLFSDNENEYQHDLRWMQKQIDERYDKYLAMASKPANINRSKLLCDNKIRQQLRYNN